MRHYALAMRIAPGAAALGVAIGSAVAQTTTVVLHWITIGPHYYATVWTLYAIERYPLWLVAIVHLVEAMVIGLIPAIVLVPVLRRVMSLRSFPGCLYPILGSVMIACLPFAFLGIYLTAGDFLLTVFGGSTLAVAIAAVASLVIRRGEQREAAAIAAAFDRD